MDFSKFKIQIWVGGWKFRRVQWPSHGQAWHRCWLCPHLTESESGVRLLLSLGGGLRLDIIHSSMLERQKKSCPAFCLFKWRSSINKQPLFVPLPLSLSLLYLELLFCGLLWYWQHCMLVVTVCLQGSIKTKWVCTNEVPANQSKWSESESKESFFLLHSTQAWEPLQEHQNRCIIVSCIQALHQLHNSKHI